MQGLEKRLNGLWGRVKAGRLTREVKLTRRIEASGFDLSHFRVAKSLSLVGEKPFWGTQGGRKNGQKFGIWKGAGFGAYRDSFEAFFGSREGAKH